MKTRTRDGDQVVKDTFGASLYQQGRAFYVSLEFLAMVRGADAVGLPVLEAPVAPGEEPPPVRYGRTTHDFARRILVAEPRALDSRVTNELGFKTLRALLSGLAVPVPGRRQKATKWQAVHLYPYIGELIHHDAVERPGTGRATVERYFYRGAGGLVHRIIRTDPDRVRLDATRAALLPLVRDSGSALGKIASALTKHDEAGQAAKEPWLDEMESRTKIVHQTRWIELTREGVHRIVNRTIVPASERIEALMHWLPFCVAMHQLDLARRVLGVENPPALPVDFQSGANPIRQQARQCFKEASSAIWLALESRARALGYEELLTGSQNWRAGSRTFFTTTLGAVGAINAASSERYFTFSAELLVAIVAALVDGETSFERFCSEIMQQRLGFVVDGDGTAKTEFVSRIDRAHFQSNADALAAFLRGLGLLQDFSDATRMVRAHQW